MFFQQGALQANILKNGNPAEGLIASGSEISLILKSWGNCFHCHSLHIVVQCDSGLDFRNKSLN